jgi:hypothetical protein
MQPADWQIEARREELERQQAAQQKRVEENRKALDGLSDEHQGEGVGLIDLKQAVNHLRILGFSLKEIGLLLVPPAPYSKVYSWTSRSRRAKLKDQNQQTQMAQLREAKSRDEAYAMSQQWLSPAPSTTE